MDSLGLPLSSSHGFERGFGDRTLIPTSHLVPSAWEPEQPCIKLSRDKARAWPSPRRTW